MTHHVASFSTGLSSALATDRVINRYGRDNVEVVFEDTVFEDDDNYRFMKQCEARWQVPITVLCEGRNPYQVARDQSIIPNQKIAPCTFKLKIEQFTNYLSARQAATIHIGYDVTELERCDATKKAYAQFGWAVDFPLLWKPYELRPYAQVVRDDWGIEPPRMYGMGYTHANCGGCCVKQGQGDWLRTLINFPERYKQAEEWEQQMRAHPKRKDYALLRKQRNGESGLITLRELREEYESKIVTQPMLLNLDYNAGCVHCGIGAFAA